MPNSNHPLFSYFSPIAGVLLALSFAPFEYSVLATFSLAFLFYSWQGVSVTKAAVRGFLFGLGLFGFGVSWVYISIHDFGKAGILGASLVTLLFVVVWSFFPAIAGGITSKLQAKQQNILTQFIPPLIWILIENIRGYWFLNGFPWLQIAYSQIDSSLAGFVPILGVYGTGFLLALSASLIVFIVQVRSHRILGIGLLCLIWLTGAFLKSMDWTYVIGDPIKVSLIQGNISQDQKWLPENRMNSLLRYKQLTQAHWDSQLIIWPEASIPAFLYEVDEYFLKPLAEEARQHQVDLIVSLPITDETLGTMYNGVLALGQQHGVYKKNHLLPFGEYMPLQPISGMVLQSLGIRLGHFDVGGDQQAFLRAGNYRFSTSICYEDAFGEESRRNIAEAAFLVNVTNDAWFGNSIEPHQHMQIARMRALETGRYLLRATNTGLTGFVAPNGKIIKQAPLFETTVLTDTIQPRGGVTPYSTIGERSIVLILLVLLVLVLIGNAIIERH